MSISDKIEDLFKDNYDALCVFSMHYVGDIYTAEDVVMDSFLKLSEKIKDGEEIIAKRKFKIELQFSVSDIDLNNLYLKTPGG